MAQPPHDVSRQDGDARCPTPAAMAASCDAASQFSEGIQRDIAPLDQRSAAQKKKRNPVGLR
jgi:hypothetical protein